MGSPTQQRSSRRWTTPWPLLQTQNSRGLRRANGHGTAATLGHAPYRTGREAHGGGHRHQSQKKNPSPERAVRSSPLPRVPCLLTLC